MEAARTKTNLGVILKLDALTSTNDAQFVAHLVVNRLQLDEDGNICLTTPMGLQSFLDAIDKIKLELDGLANDAIIWLARSIASRHAKFAIISNSVGGQNKERVGDGVSTSCAAPSSPGQRPDVIELLPRRR